MAIYSIFVGYSFWVFHRIKILIHLSSQLGMYAGITFPIGDERWKFFSIGDSRWKAFPYWGFKLGTFLNWRFKLEILPIWGFKLEIFPLGDTVG
jgi:hypothetical protein